MNVLTGDTVAQAAHVGWGGLLCFILRRYFEDWEAVLLVVLVIAIKESSEAFGMAFWEPQQSGLSSGVDFIFFLVGIILFLIFRSKAVERESR